MALVFSNKGMLEKVMMQRTQQFLDFSILSKEPACAVARKKLRLILVLQKLANF